MNYLCTIISNNISCWPQGKLTRMWKRNGFQITFMVDCPHRCYSVQKRLPSSKPTYSHAHWPWRPHLQMFCLFQMVIFHSNCWCTKYQEGKSDIPWLYSIRYSMIFPWYSHVSPVKSEATPTRPTTATDLRRWSHQRPSPPDSVSWIDLLPSWKVRDGHGISNV